MLVASVIPAKKVQFINGDMIIHTASNEERIVPNEKLKNYAVEGIIDSEKSSNFVVRI